MTPNEFIYIATNLGLGGAVLYVFYKYLNKLDDLTKAIADLRATQEKLIVLIDMLLRGEKK
jgi:hypothetical protein